MSALTFTLKNNPRQHIDVSPLTPDTLAAKGIEEISAILLQSGNKQYRADDLFDISGADTSNLIFAKAAKLDFVGAKMKTGSITVHGNAAHYLGFGMKSGQITVDGNVDSFCASGMSGGMITVEGNAGDFLAGAIAGEKKGMRGGIVIIRGNAGDRVGDQMRRGIILIEGNVGNYCGSRMLAGTIGVLGKLGSYTAYGMRRGTLLVFEKPSLHATIQDCGTHTLPFLNLMFKSFKNLPSKFATLDKNRVRRFGGDIANDGRGEILVFI